MTFSKERTKKQCPKLLHKTPFSNFYFRAGYATKCKSSNKKWSCKRQFEVYHGAWNKEIEELDVFQKAKGQQQNEQSHLANFRIFWQNVDGWSSGMRFGTWCASWYIFWQNCSAVSGRSSTSSSSSESIESLLFDFFQRGKKPLLELELSSSELMFLRWMTVPVKTLAVSCWIRRSSRLSWLFCNSIRKLFSCSSVVASRFSFSFSSNCKVYR